MEGLTFFDILIILFLAFSFLSSIFKAKKGKQDKSKQESKQEQTGTQVRRTQTPPPVPYKVNEPVEVDEEEYDIMKEIESFFKVGDEEEKQKQREVERKKQPAQHRKFEPEIRQTKSYQQAKEKAPVAYDTFSEKSKKIKAATDRKLRELKNINVDTSFFEKTEGQVISSLSDNFSFNFKSKLKDKSNLKEFVLFSEIIGKPKVLRRR